MVCISSVLYHFQNSIKFGKQIVIILQKFLTPIHNDVKPSSSYSHRDNKEIKRQLNASNSTNTHVCIVTLVFIAQYFLLMAIYRI